MACQSLLDGTVTLLSASCTPAELAFACEVVAPISKRACRLPASSGGSRLHPLFTHIGDSYEQ
jgi:hypothetical protein